MAAIISQMAANKRARQANRHAVISSDKCVYSLPPFDRCFDPTVHNKYVKATTQRKLMETRSEMEARIREEKRKEIKKIEEDAKVVSDLLSGLAILVLGFCLVLLLVFYIWIILWNVGDGRTSGGGGGQNTSAVFEGSDVAADNWTGN